ncbi:MAG: hypothetical protein V4773_27655 [Verrucomicrobiota bacterium]
MNDKVIEAHLVRAEQYVRQAKRLLEHGERSDARWYTRRAANLLTLVTQARLVRAAAQFPTVSSTTIAS